MDLNKLAGSDTVTFDVAHPRTKQPLEGCRTTAFSTLSKHFRAAKHRQNNADLAVRKKGGGVTSEDFEASATRLLAECIESWAWPEMQIHGKPVPELTVENAVWVLNQLPWYRAQLNEEMAADANFLEIAPER